MRSFVLRILLAMLAILPGVAAGAETAPIFTAPGITITDIGIYCRPGTSIKETAPETTLGYVRQLPGTPEFAFRQQEVPARLGVHFGVLVMSDHDIARVRNETWRPGATRPDVWHTDLTASAPRARGFLFEFPDELVTGTWRMDAFDGGTLLYSVEWDVRPGDELPGISSDCDLLS